MINSKSDPGYKMCSYTVMDNIADPGISFDENGICNYVHEYNAFSASKLKKGEEGTRLLEAKIDKIKQEGKGKPYDCIVGVSGGVDSTYVAYIAKKYALRPLVVHFDNGWNSELAVQNIQNIVEKLNCELFTYVIKWEEFRDIQRAFFKAGVVDIELITDHAILATVYKLAKRHNIHYILSGSNIATEAILPKAWIWDKSDWLNIKSIHRKFGSVKLKTFPHMTFIQYLMNSNFFKMESINVLDFMEYKKDEVKEIIARELGWRDYGGKHHESIFTRFYQAFILPEKFHIDKRKAHLSTLICSGQLTREEALLELEKPLYDTVKLAEDKEFVQKKLGFSRDEFEKIMHSAPHPHDDYPNYHNNHWQKYWKLLEFTRPLRHKLRGSKA